jgi:acetyltransferase-like isoleucine patch superfamily enzyme
MDTGAREIGKAAIRGLAAVAVMPAVCSYRVRALILGPDRALQGSTQAFAVIPGLIGQYLRRAFLSRTLARCASSATIEFGTIFSSAAARIEEHAYIGPNCTLGLVHVERDVLIGPAVHIPSGRQTHGTGDPAIPIREQPGRHELVRIGAGAWIGSAAVVMADVGRSTVVGAGAVVTRPTPDEVVVGGVPARVLRRRDGRTLVVAAGA